MFAFWKKAKAQAEGEAAVGMVINSLTHRLMQPNGQLDDRFWENSYFMGFLFGLVNSCGIKHLNRRLTGNEFAEIFSTTISNLTKSTSIAKRARTTIVAVLSACQKDYKDHDVLYFDKGAVNGQIFFALVMGSNAFDSDETVIKGRQIDAAFNRMLGDSNASGAGYLQLTLRAEYERCYGKIEFV
jgi:hypothetical protein